MIREFRNTFEAYSYTQYSDEITFGDTLLIESECVVALAWTWPVAVTIATGQFHYIEDPDYAPGIIEDAGWTDKQICLAVREAVKRGWPIAEWAKKFV